MFFVLSLLHSGIISLRLSAHWIIVGFHHVLLAIVRRLSEPALTDLVTFDVRVSVGRTLEELLLPDAATRVWANGPVTYRSFCLGWSELARIS